MIRILTSDPNECYKYPLDNIFPIVFGRKELLLYCDDTEQLHYISEGIKQISEYTIPTLSDAEEFLTNAKLEYTKNFDLDKTALI